MLSCAPLGCHQALVADKGELAREIDELRHAHARLTELVDASQHMLVDEKRSNEEMGKELTATRSERDRLLREKDVALDVKCSLFQLTVRTCVRACMRACVRA